MAMWEVAIDKISVLLFTSCQVIKSYSSMKLARSNPYRIYLMEEDNLGKRGRANETIFKSKGLVIKNY